MLKYIYSPILVAVAIVLFILAAAPFVRDWETDPIVRALGAWVGAYSAIVGVLLVTCAGFVVWKLRS